MKKILFSFVFIALSYVGFAQSVTILPTSTLGGSGSSQWTTTGNSNIHFGVGTTNRVGIGTEFPFAPLHIYSTVPLTTQPNLLLEKRNNQVPSLNLLKYGGTTAAPAAVTLGEIGRLSFSGSTSDNGYAEGASITARAKGTFAQNSYPTQLEFNTAPVGGNIVPLTRMTIDENGKVGINNNTPIAQLDLRYDGSSFHSVHFPMLNINGPTGNPVFVRYSSLPTTNFSILQEALGSATLNSTNIRWRWYDNASPSQGTTLFEWANNAFNITGSLTTAGNASITGTGNFTGRIASGSASATTAGLDITNTTNTDASPGIHLRGTNNILRFGNTINTAAIFQTVVGDGTAANSSVVWKHVTAANVSTPMMTIEGDGDLTVNKDATIAGFTKLGGTAADVPAIKNKILTGNIALNTSGVTTTVAHGLTASKIVDIKVLVTGLSNVTVTENFVDTRTTGAISGYQFSTFTDLTNIYIMRHPTNGANIGNGGGLVSTYRILITYIP